MLHIINKITQFGHLAKNYHLPFIKKVHEIDNIYSFYFDKKSLKYDSGQHFFVNHTHENQDSRGSMRILSASSSASDPYIVFTMRIFEDGSSFKKSFMDLKQGDTITLRGPSPIHDYFGIKDRMHTYVYVVGGIGITPVHAILKESSDLGLELRAHILYCNSNDQILFEDEINSYIKKLPNASIEYIQSPQRIAEEQFAKLSEMYGKNTRFILSGSDGFVNNYEKCIKDAGIESRNVFAYHFSFGGSSYSAKK